MVDVDNSSLQADSKAMSTGSVWGPGRGCRLALFYVHYIDEPDVLSKWLVMMTAP